jgi:PleD family two-component response regulator
VTNIDCANLSVLVVDDQKTSRELVRQNLLKMSFADIDMATTSAEAEEKIAAKPYDIVFIDWVMPGKSGLALMQAYREDRAFDHVAFVMVTIQSREKGMVEALKAGATAYIVKPILPSQFVPRMETVLAWIEKVNPRFRKKNP